MEQKKPTKPRQFHGMQSADWRKISNALKMLKSPDFEEVSIKLNLSEGTGTVTKIKGEINIKITGLNY